MEAVITAVFAVFTAIGEWFVSIIPVITAIFYVAESGLTFIGTLAVCGLGVAIIMLILAVIRSYVNFRR